MHRQSGTVALVLWTTLAIATPATADVVADWNVCAPPIIAAGRATIQFGAGPATQLDLAVVHLAMHDAIQAYDQRYEPYAGAIAAGEGSAIAAAAKAAHTVLLTKFPMQGIAIDACYAASMAGVMITPADLIASNAVGTMAAGNVLCVPRWRRQLSNRSHRALHGRFGPRSMASKPQYDEHGRALARRRAAVRDRDRATLPTGRSAGPDELRLRGGL